MKTTNLHFLLCARLAGVYIYIYTWVRCLGREDPLEKEMAIHSSTLAWKIPWTEDPGRQRSPWGRKELDTTERLHFTEWSSGFPYFLQFKSEFGNKELMICATVSFQSCFF